MDKCTGKVGEICQSDDVGTMASSHGSHMDWKNGVTFFQSGKSQEILKRLEKSGNFTQNT